MKTAKDYSGFGNKVLYEMCVARPKHTDLDTIASKVWLIGRSYAAAIERQAPVKPGKDFYRTTVAPRIRGSKIDDWIESVANINPLTRENLPQSLECHKRLTELFRSFTGQEKRSLASKYLHFHAPQAFFIYDSIANERVRRKLGKRSRGIKPPSGFDDKYAAFCCRCLLYRDDLEQQLGKLVTPRLLDMYLLKSWPLS